MCVKVECVHCDFSEPIAVDITNIRSPQTSMNVDLLHELRFVLYMQKSFSDGTLYTLDSGLNFTMQKGFWTNAKVQSTLGDSATESHPSGWKPSPHNG